MHLFYSDMLDEAFHYAQSMPKGSDIFITTDEQNKVDNISDLLRKEDYCVEIRIVKNRGRSESALLVGMADAVGRYDLICFWKEKKSGHIDPVGAAQGWWYKISENLLHSKVFVENIIATFSDNRQLGMLSPTPPNHSKLYAIMGREWDDDYENAVLLAERLNLHVPMSEKKPPICPLGGSFWFRPAALRKLFEYGWSYDDFPTEPIATGGTLLHALERIYPFVAQDAGYCPAYVLSDRFASIEYTNLSHYLRSSNLLAKRWGVDHLNYIATIDEMDRMLAINGTASQSLKTHIKQYMKTRFPRPIFLIVLGLKRLVFGPDRKNCVLDAMRHFHKNP
jgi:rhamnosyltransferase